MAGLFSEFQYNLNLFWEKGTYVIFFENQQNYEIVIKYPEYYNYSYKVSCAYLSFALREKRYHDGRIFGRPETKARGTQCR